MKPRNTLVTVAPIKKAEKKVGNIVLPKGQNDQYQEAEVIAVGPGMITNDDDRSQCADLRPGQVVLVQVASRRPGPTGGHVLESMGLDYKTDDGRELVIVEQSQIVGVVKEPEEYQSETPAYGVLPHDAPYHRDESVADGSRD